MRFQTAELNGPTAPKIYGKEIFLIRQEKILDI
jgi:hypothetical protein